MPHPRHRRLMRKQIGGKVLQPQGLTAVGNGDQTNTTNLANLQNIALYSKGGWTPTFAAGSTGLLSNAVSNADTAWTQASYTGETANAGAVGITAASAHYMLGTATNTMTTLSGTANDPDKPTYGSVIVYTTDGPQASYVPYYLGGTATTGSILFGTKLTGSETNVQFTYFGKAVNGDKLRVAGASNRTPFVKVGGGFASITFDGNAVTSSFKIAKTDLALSGGFYLEYSSSVATSTTPVPGIVVVISASA